MPRGQVRRRIDPVQTESPRGYLCRVTEAFCYESPVWLTELANFTRVDHLDSPNSVDELASVLRLAPDIFRHESSAVLQRHVSLRNSLFISNAPERKYVDRKRAVSIYRVPGDVTVRSQRESSRPSSRDLIRRSGRIFL
jgi:hypothetical protein